MLRKTIFISMLLAAVYAGGNTQKGLSDLRCEGMENPLGIDNTQPHFSWKNTEKNFQQTAYEIEVASDLKLLKSGKADLWKSGKINSRESVMIPYKGCLLQSRQLCYWRVKTYNNKGGKWSSIQRFSVGIIDNDQFKGDYIGLGLGEATSVLLNREFELTDNKGIALLHVNSLGYHEVYVNGKKTDDAVLVPAVSQMDKRSLIVTYDITQLLKKGKNNIVLWIGSGWYKKATFKATYNGPAVRADLDVYSKGKWTNILKTDISWKGCESGYYDTGSWLPGRFGGERIDAAMVTNDFSNVALTSKAWKNVEIAQISNLKATPQMCQKNTVKEIVTAVKVDSMAKDTWLVDMGKVMTGLVEMHFPALPKGHEIKVTYGDDFDKKGELIKIGGDDYFIASGNSKGDTFINRFNHHCFRYFILSNLPKRPSTADLKSRRIGLNTNVIGSFECSDKDLNAIHNMITYTMSGLAFSGYMVDCSHIERLGYGGDGNASTLSLQNYYDASPMYLNWLTAWNDAIRPDGSLPHTAPNPYSAGGGPYWCSFIVQAPWRTWINFGDDRPLRRCYDNMKLWLKYVDAYTTDGLLQKWPNNEYRNWYLGDWLAPKGIDVTNEESIKLVNNCALSQSYRELIQIAEYLQKPEDKAEFIKRREALNDRIHKTFYHKEDSRYGTGSQLDMVYPLLVDAVPDNLVKTMEDALITRIDTAYRNHLYVGLVGIPILTEWATLTRNVNLMYTMLKQKDYPGYLYMIRNGATGTWENWRSPRSHYHNCYNGIDSWFIQALGGIIPIEPGYRKVSINPQVPKGLEWVNVTRETPYGTIKVNWKQLSGKVNVHIELPSGIIAIVNNKETSENIIDYTVAINE